MGTQGKSMLYLRIVIGGMLLLRNISKMQSYNELINDYPSMDGIAGGTIFAFFLIVESLSAVMLISGWRVRLASVILIAQSILSLMVYFPYISDVEVELHSIFIFIYVYFFINGGGVYALDRVRPSELDELEE